MKKELVGLLALRLLSAGPMSVWSKEPQKTVYPLKPRGEVTDCRGRMGCLKREIGRAMKRKDEGLVYILVQEQLTRALGKKAGSSEGQARERYYKRVRGPVRDAQIQEVGRNMAKKLMEIYSGNGRWRKHPNEEKLIAGTGAPMIQRIRDIVVPARALLNLEKAGFIGEGELGPVIEQATAFVLRAQGSNGAFGYPDCRNVRRVEGFEPTYPKFKKLMEKAVRADPRNLERGWIIDDPEGGIQFDNGLAGLFLIDAYRRKKSPELVQAIRRSAQWARDHDSVLNFNYNAFSVEFLAGFYALTGERQWLRSAVEKARVGMFPGLIERRSYRGQAHLAKRSGRFVDPHNARLAYHGILMRATAVLLESLPLGSPEVRFVKIRLSWMIDRIEDETRRMKGIPHSGPVVEAMVLAKKSFKKHSIPWRWNRLYRQIQLVSFSRGGTPEGSIYFVAGDPLR